MNTSDVDRQFAGSIPQFYERHMVPLIFSAFAEDMATRVARTKPLRVLEIAAGTGVVTRALARCLDAQASIVATDLNPPMLEHAASLGTARPVQWQQADAQQLPFPDGSFDAVVCQFGAMFFPDRPRAYAEAHRVLREGGRYFFNVWDRLECNGFAEVVTDAVAPLFPGDPPRFLARVPYGYHDAARVAIELEQGGFTRSPEFAIVRARSEAPEAREPAMAFCLGTPLRNEIEARNPALLGAATEAATAAIAQRYGNGPVEATIQAIVVTVPR
jgi:SAM-dependent methyltransferase